MPNPVDASLYTSEYFLERCGGIEFFKRFGYSVLKPAIQAAVLAADLKPGQKILDVGCGRGELVANLHEKGFEATGFDYSPDAIEVAKKMYPPGNFVLLNAGNAGLGEGRYDRVFALGFIEHLHRQELDFFLDQVDQVLASGGRVLMTTCVNKLYYKTWTYRLRIKIARISRGIGFNLRDPLPPRSDEDESLHINEMNYFDLMKQFSTNKWKATVWPQPNAKLIADRLYSAEVLAQAPLRRAPRWKQFLYKAFVFHFPLNLFLARFYLIELRRRS